jgi:glycine/D-amino acid oxidase-like deaminating enzyme
MTPITGPRLAGTWNWQTCWPLACDFYRKIEEETGTALLDVRGAVRLFHTAPERQVFEKRMAQTEFRTLVREPEPVLNSHWFRASGGGFEMVPAARLNVAQYLDVSRDRFRREERFFTATIDPDSEINIRPQEVLLPRLGIRSRHLIFCQGFQKQQPVCWQRVRFNPAQGEILTIHAPGVEEQRTVHCGIWLAPAGGDRFRIGSTFEWKQLDGLPTPAGREELLARLKEFFRVPLNVIDHQAAVRPTMTDFRPVVGLHPHNSRLGIFSGLGTRGSLMAPWLAELFAAHLMERIPLSREVEAARWFR